jgi:hypothetical protein
MRYNDPIGYLITFTCYGARVHGDERGSVHHDDTRFTFPVVKPDPEVERVMRERMVQEPLALDAKMRFIVDKTAREVFEHREWNLGQLSVRSNHVHIVAAVNCAPEKVIATSRLGALAGCARKG